MKNKIKLIFTSILTIFILVSCSDDRTLSQKFIDEFNEEKAQKIYDEIPDTDKTYFESLEEFTTNDYFDIYMNEKFGIVENSADAGVYNQIVAIQEVESFVKENYNPEFVFNKDELYLYNNEIISEEIKVDYFKNYSDQWQEVMYLHKIVENGEDSVQIYYDVWESNDYFYTEVVTLKLSKDGYKIESFGLKPRDTELNLKEIFYAEGQHKLRYLGLGQDFIADDFKIKDDVLNIKYTVPLDDIINENFANKWQIIMDNLILFANIEEINQIDVIFALEYDDNQQTTYSITRQEANEIINVDGVSKDVASFEVKATEIISIIKDNYYEEFHFDFSLENAIKRVDETEKIAVANIYDYQNILVYKENKTGQNQKIFNEMIPLYQNKFNPQYKYYTQDMFEGEVPQNTLITHIALNEENDVFKVPVTYKKYDINDTAIKQEWLDYFTEILPESVPVIITEHYEFDQNNDGKMEYIVVCNNQISNSDMIQIENNEMPVEDELWQYSYAVYFSEEPQILYEYAYKESKDKLYDGNDGHKSVYSSYDGDLSQVEFKGDIWQPMQAVQYNNDGQKQIYPIYALGEYGYKEEYSIVLADIDYDGQVELLTMENAIYAGLIVYEFEDGKLVKQTMTYTGA